MQRGRAARDLGSSRHVQGLGLLPDRFARQRCVEVDGLDKVGFIKFLVELKLRVVRAARAHHQCGGLSRPVASPVRWLVAPDLILTR